MSRITLALTLVVVALAALPAGASAQSIVNNTTWLESQSFANSGGVGPGLALGVDSSDIGRTARYRVLVKDIAGRKITKLRIDDNFDGTDDTLTGGDVNVTAEVPDAGAFNYSVASLSKDIPNTSNTGITCTGTFSTGGTRRVPASSNKVIRMRAVLSDNTVVPPVSQGALTQAVNFVANVQPAGGCGEDFPFVYPVSQTATNVTPGQSVTFTFQGEDIDGSGADTFSAINWRWRNSMTGAATGTTFADITDDDRKDRTITLSAPATRGRWILEATAMSDGNSTSNSTYNAGYFFYLGALNVNAAASSGPTVSLSGLPSTATRLTGTATVTASVGDTGGQVQMVEWDADGDATNGPLADGFERREYVGDANDTRTDPNPDAVGISATALSQTVNQSDVPAGPLTVRVRVTDNGAANAADAARRVATASATTFVNRAPVVTSPTHTFNQPAAPLVINATDVGTDANGDALTISPNGTVAHGTLEQVTPGQLKYIPNADFQGTEAIPFKVGDGFESTAGTVTAKYVPNTQIDTRTVADGAATQTREHTFTFSSPQNGVDFECRTVSVLGGANPWVDCDSGSYTTTTLGDDKWTFEVRAIGSVATDPTPASTSFRVDTTKPVTTFLTGPSGPTNVTSPTWTFEVADAGPDVLECRFTALGIVGDWADCETPGAPGEPQRGSYSAGAVVPLAEGEYTLEVRATDAVGLVESPVAKRTITVDTTAPVTTITSGPEGEVPSNDAEFSFSSSEAGSTFVCTLTPGSSTPCNSGTKTYDDLPDGTYTFAVVATDPAGNPSSEAAEVTFTVDTTAPDTAIATGPDLVTNKVKATFTFGSPASDADRYECRLDDADTWAGCASPETWGGLEDGEHSLDVRAIDRVGNTDPTPDRYEWRVDRTAPQTAFSAAPAAHSGSSSAHFEYAAGEPATFTCRLDGGPVTDPCSSPQDLTGLADGEHRFEVLAKDVAGNPEATAAIHHWTVDTVAPAVKVEDPPAAISGSTTARFAFSATDGSPAADAPEAEFRCSVDGAPYEVCGSPFETTVTGGDHTLDVKAVDQAGNESPDEHVAWKVRDTAPAAPTVDSFLPGEGVKSRFATASAAFSLAEETHTAECRIDTDAWQACESPYRAEALTDGDHTMELRAVDDAGTRGPATSLTWAVDGRAPSTTITKGPKGLGKSDVVQFTWTVDEAGTTSQCRVDDGDWATCASPYEVDELEDGDHRFEVRSTDGAQPTGNTEATPARRDFSVDTQAPSVAITSGPANVYDGKAEIKFTGSEPGLLFTCRDGDADTWRSCGSPWSLSDLADGEHLLSVRATDAAGNASAPATQRVIALLGGDRVPETRAASTSSGSFRARLAEGAIKIGNAPELKLGPDTVQINGDLSSTGALTIPADGVAFKPVTLELEQPGLGKLNATVKIEATGGGTGQLSPGGGAGSLKLPIRAKLEVALANGVPVLGPASQCYIGPIELNLGAAEWNPAAGRLVLTDGGASVPGGGEGCGVLGAQVNSALGLPAGPGQNAVRLVFSLGEVAQSASSTAPTAKPTATKAKPPVVKLGSGSRFKLDRKGRLKLTLSCPKGTAVCEGKLAVRAIVPKGKKKPTVTVGSTSYKITAGKRATRTITISRAARRLVTSRKKLAVTVSLTPTGEKKPQSTKKLTIVKGAGK